MSKKKRLLHLGFFCPQEYFELHDKAEKNHQYAARKLESRIVEGLRENNIEMETVGLYPARIFPRNRTLFFKGFKGKDMYGRQAQAVGYINFPLFSHMSRAFSVFMAGWRVLRKEFFGSSAILVYSLHTPLVLAAAVLSKLFHIPFYIYIPDLPQYMNVGVKRGRLFRFLKRIDTSLVLWLSDQAAGIIGITSDLVSSRAAWNSKRTAVLEGIAEVTGESKEKQQQHEEEVLRKYGLERGFLFYAGGLAESYGVSVLLDTFKLLEGRVHLVLCGAGPLEAEVHKAATEYTELHYLGSISPEDVKALSRCASFLINPRIPGEPYLRYSFPSKLLEYMATGKPVITSRLPGIPQDYYDYLLVLDVVNTQELIKCLQDNAGERYSSACWNAERGVAFCRDNKLARQQGEKIVQTIFSDTVG